jgi:hypothetical protein
VIREYALPVELAEDHPFVRGVTVVERRGEHLREHEHLGTQSVMFVLLCYVMLCEHEHLGTPRGLYAMSCSVMLCEHEHLGTRAWYSEA